MNKNKTKDVAQYLIYFLKSDQISVFWATGKKAEPKIEKVRLVIGEAIGIIDLISLISISFLVPRIKRIFIQNTYSLSFSQHILIEHLLCPSIGSILIEHLLCGGPQSKKGPALFLLFCYCCLKILSNF